MNNDEIDTFFNEYVEGFMWTDIAATIEAKANFVVALALLNYTEVLGGLANGRLGEEHVAGNCFRDGLAKMTFNGDATYYASFRVMLTDSEKTTREADAWKVFRCGLTHEYFPKGIATVANSPGHADPRASRPELPGFGWMPIDGVESLAFFTNAFYRDLRAAFDRLKTEIKADDEARARFGVAVKRITGRTVAKKP